MKLDIKKVKYLANQIRTDLNMGHYISADHDAKVLIEYIESLYPTKKVTNPHMTR